MMADDIVIEDPIGEAPTNSDGNGVRGRADAGVFYDTTIAKAITRRITCEETFPSSSPTEIAHILNLHFEFEGGITSDVRGVFTYRVDDAGLLTNLRGYWNMAAMKIGRVEVG